MPEYINGRICLTRKESSGFLDKITHPCPLAAALRDDFLGEISRTIKITQLDDGVLVEDVQTNGA